jgi:ketosteroid isomerase-like protein
VSTPEDVVRRYLRVFVTRDLDELAAVMAEDVAVYGAGRWLRGRDVPAAAILTPGVTVVDQRVVELVAAGDRVSVVVENTYRHHRTGAETVQSACKIYQVTDGRIVRFWGEADTWGLLTGLGLVETHTIDFG